ncbi:MAG: hypothetical protein K0U41_02380 [Gammaproteobacteria bacterium]|nr:hypothetical protein [Gammaproteobacteria bacterium]
MKTYSSKSTAVRAARRDLSKQNPELNKNQIDELYTIEPHAEKQNEYYWRRVQVAVANDQLPNVEADEALQTAWDKEQSLDDIDAADIAAMSDELLVDEVTEQSDVFFEEPIYNTTPKKNVSADVEAFVANGGEIETAPTRTGPYAHLLEQVDKQVEQQVERVRKQTSVAGPNTKVVAEYTTSDGMLRRSAVVSPCRLVWDIAEKMFEQNARRKDIVQACVDQGVATHTARTQYQKWLTAHKASQRPAIAEA